MSSLPSPSSRRLGLLGAIVIALCLLLGPARGASVTPAAAATASPAAAVPARHAPRARRRHARARPHHARHRARRHHAHRRHRAHPHRHHRATTPRPGRKTTPPVSPPAPVATPVPASAPTATPTATSGDPLAGDRFYVDPHDSAATNEASLRAQGQTAEADQLAVIAAQPQAEWLANDASAAAVPGIVSAAAAAGEVPVLVVYNLPGRDCGSYSAGGASSAQDYESFIDTIAAGLGQSRAAVIVEPDALSDSCLTSSWDQLLSYALTHLDADANASVYLDAGNPGWHPPSYEAGVLAPVIGASRAGFAVNVSNFYSTAADIAYGTSISQALGGRHFVIDTSRNGGSVASGQWCNPNGAALGTAPTTDTGNPLVDAELWIKTPGESDGTCNGGPGAGQFWLSYALSLVSN